MLRSITAGTNTNTMTFEKHCAGLLAQMLMSSLSMGCNDNNEAVMDEIKILVAEG